MTQTPTTPQMPLTPIICDTPPCKQLVRTLTNRDRIAEDNSYRLDDIRIRNYIDIYEYKTYPFYNPTDLKWMSSSDIEYPSFCDKICYYVKSIYNNDDNRIQYLDFKSKMYTLINRSTILLTMVEELQCYDDEATYLKVPEESDYFIDAQRNIAFNYSREKIFDDVENKIKLIVEKNDNDYEIKKILADFYRIEKKFDLAIKIYSELIKQNPNDLWYTFYLRGICYEQSDNWEKAELDFLQSLKLKRDSPNVLNYLAYGWIERDIRIDESFVMLTDAYEANPDSHYILDSLAWAYFKKKDYIKAAELMEEVIDMVPGEAVSLDHLGDIYFAMNRKREAIYFWRQAKDLAKPEDEIIDNIEKKLREFHAS